MTEIKRYEAVLVDGVPAHRPSELGRWVMHEDHAAIVAALQEQVRALAAEGSAIKQAFKQAANTVEEYEIYGDLKYAVEPSEYEALADAIEETPNTDATLREIRAQVVHSFSEDCKVKAAKENFVFWVDVSSAAKEYADSILAGEKS